MKTIRLIDRLEENIATRDSVISFFKSVRKLSSKEIILDFNQIKFMSRSAVHEYLRQKDKTKKNIKEIHVSQEIETMFSHVKSEEHDESCSRDIISKPSDARIETISLL